LFDIAAIDAAVTDKLAKIGVTVSTSAIESRGRACLGTTKVPPGNISSLSKDMNGSRGILNPFFSS
jgi:hypothetical protein